MNPWQVIDALGRASVEGGLLILAVWGICRGWRTAPAWVRAGMWWLASARLLVALVPLTTVHLTLPSPPVTAVWWPSATAATTTIGPPAPAEHRPAATQVAPSVARDVPVVSATVAVHDDPPRRLPRLDPAWLAIGFCILWVAGLTLRSFGLARQLRRVRRARGFAQPLDAAARLALGVDSRVLLAWSAEAPVPMVTGLLRPVVLIPSSMRARPNEELRLAVAHELAHVRRGDLWLGWIPALAEALFWFHPLVARAADEYSQACEEACDAEALRATGADPYVYGRVLLALGVHHRWHGVTAMPCGSHDSRHLSRRLSRLTPFAPLDPRLKRIAVVVLCGFALVDPRRSGGADVSRPAGGFATAPLAVVTVEPAAAADPDVATVDVTADRVDVTVDAADEAAPQPETDAKKCPSSHAACTTSEKACKKSSAASAPEAPETPDVDVATAAPAPPATPTYPASQPAPAAVPSVAAAATASAAPRPPRPPAYSYAWSDDDGKRQRFAYVLVQRSGESSGMTGSGNGLDWQDVARLKEKQDGDFLWVRRDDRRYVIDAPALIRRVKDAFAPQAELGKHQSEIGSMQSRLGEQQSELGERQSQLGAQQSEIGAQQARLASEMARRTQRRMSAEDLERRSEELSDQMDELGRAQERLSSLMEPLSEQQGKLGGQMETLSRQMTEVSRSATLEVRELIDAAIRDGKAKPLR
jgi:beta-lactamase regulating signal transducer with metallopeptidase domain